MAKTQIDLEGMNREQLESLISDAKKALNTLEVRRKQEAKRAAEEALRAYGFSLSDVFDPGKKPSGKVSKSPPKYVHPDNPALTWTGRGRKPKWISEALDAGKSLDDFAIS